MMKWFLLLRDVGLGPLADPPEQRANGARGTGRPPHVGVQDLSESWGVRGQKSGGRTMLSHIGKLSYSLLPCSL